MMRRPEFRRCESLSIRGAVVLILIALVVQAGCSLQGGPETFPVSEPYPTLGKARPTRNRVCSLVVITETFLELALGDNDEGARMHHTGYTLYDQLGRKIDYIRNYIGSQDSEPMTVELEPGRYLILLDRPEKNPPVFWVVIEPEKRTEVNLLGK